MNNRTSDINKNNTAFLSTQHMGVAWGAFPLNNRCTCVTLCTVRALLQFITAGFESTIGAH